MGTPLSDKNPTFGFITFNLFKGGIGLIKNVNEIEIIQNFDAGR